VNCFAKLDVDLFAATESEGILRSTNNGADWNPVDSGLTNMATECLAVSGSDLLAGTWGSGVFRSTDKGASWSTAGLSNIHVRSITIVGANIFVGAFQDGYLSTDNGATWHSLNIGQSWNFVMLGHKVFARIGNGVSSSSDNGATWTPTSMTNSFPWTIAVSGTNLVLGSGYYGVFVSTDSGSSWTPANGGMTENWITSFAIADGNLFAATRWGGVFLSTNHGASWRAVNRGFTNCTPVGFAVVGTDLFAACSGSDYVSAGIFRTSDNGASWCAIRNGLPSNPNYGYYLTMNCIYAYGNALYAGCNGGYGIFRSTDNGAHWTSIFWTSILGNGTVTGYTSSGTHLFAAMDGWIFGSTDSGATWNFMESEYTMPMYYGLNTIVFCDTVLLAGINSVGAFRSTDFGASWTAANTGLPKGAGVTAFGVSGANLFAGTQMNGVYASTNGGITWSQAGSGVQNTRIYGFAFSGTNLFAATGVGVFLSTNYGASWTPASSGLPNTAVVSLAVLGNYLFAGCSNAGAWARPLSEMTSVHEVVPVVPMSFSLSQNYPNPFNPSTIIKYELPKASVVRLSVFDILGREVSVLVYERENAGSYEVKFDGSSSASGVYFYRLQAGSFVQTRKLLLLR
jgi:hypothetical protein